MGNVASAFSFPDTSQAECALLAVPVPMLPLVLGAFGQLQDRRYWQTDQDWQGAYEAIAAIEASAMTTCLSSLVASQDRLYRLLDSALTGTIYAVTETDPLTIEPAIPDVPDLSTPPTSTSLLGMLDALPGVLDAGWFGIGGHKATLADIVRSLRVGDQELATDKFNTMKDLLTESGSAATIANTIGNLFESGVQDLEEGGIFLTLIASSLAIAGLLQGISVTQGIQSVALQAIIEALRGDSPQDDNILQALRGSTKASDTRNIADLLS